MTGAWVVVAALVTGLLALLLALLNRRGARADRAEDARLRELDRDRDDQRRREDREAEAQRRVEERRHQDQRQWDGDVVRLASEMIALARALAPLAVRDWRGSEREDFSERIYAGMDRFDLAVVELQLRAPSLSAAAATFAADCDRRIRGEWEEFDVGHPQWTGLDMSVKLEETITTFVTAVQKAIRVSDEAE